MERQGDTRSRGGESNGATPETRLAATLELLEQGVTAILDSDTFRAYLQTMSRFHAYSFRNVLLIQTQRPEATHVAGFRRWQQVGRQVRKGEQGIRILVPHTRTIDLEEGKTARIVRGFGVRSVFDISQTDGTPLPEPPAAAEIHSKTETGAALYAALESYVTAQGVRVGREELARSNGYYAPVQRRIVVASRLEEDQATKTLAHETAHYVAGHRGLDLRADAETVAESAAYVVLQHFGLDSGGYTFPYVARWAEDREVLQRNLAAIQQTSHVMITGVAEQAHWPQSQRS